jgi:hypothetical protein
MPKEIKNFLESDLNEQIKSLYLNATFIVAIRYYGYKINLYLVHDHYVEVFYNHKDDCIEKVELLDFSHSRMKFYEDQIGIQSLAS